MMPLERRYMDDDEYMRKVESAAKEIERMRQRGMNVEIMDLVALKWRFGVPFEYVPSIVRDAQALLDSRHVPTDTEQDARRYLESLT